MKYILSTAVLLFALPLAVFASSARIFVDLYDDSVVITKGSTTNTVSYKPLKDLQAMKIKRDGKEYIVTLRWRKDIVRLYIYDTKGNKIDSEKVLTSKDGRDWSTIRLEYRRINDKPRIQVRGVKLNAAGEAYRIVRKRYRVNPNKKDPIKYKSDKKTDISYPDFTGLTDQEQGHKLFNYWRKSAGLLPARRDGDLDVACSKHAYYMKVNDTNEHNEDPDKPGYTEEGDFAGRGSNLTGQTKPSMVQSMNILIEGTYHRILMIVNELGSYGYAIDGPSASGRYYGCQEILSGSVGFEIIGSELNYPYFDGTNTRWPIVVPGNGEERVLTTLQPGEFPDPLANFGLNYPAGYPITATLGTHHSDLHLQLFDDQNNQVFAYFQPPGDQNDPNVLYQGVSYSLIPAAPLKSGTRYKVRMTGKYKGNDFVRESYFTTQ